jgi:hypothetical protein
MSNSRIQEIGREYAGKQCYAGESSESQKINFRRITKAFIAGHKIGFQEGLNVQAFYIAELDRLEKEAQKIKEQLIRYSKEEG